MKSLPRFLTLLLLAIPLASQAQLLVDIQLDKDSYVCQEATVATITVENRAGKDIVLGGPDGGSWLMMDVRQADPGNVEGKLISGINGQEPKASTVLLEAGGSVQRKVDLQAFYPMGQGGQFTVSCAVYFAELNRWMGPAKPTPVLISSPRTPFFQTTVGVTDEDGKSSYLRYKLFASPTTLTTPKRERIPQNLLYIQIVDEATEDTLRIYPLSEVTREYYQPQATVDVANDLHVLYASAPRMWTYATITPKGKLKQFSNYEAVESSKPDLTKNKAGAVYVKGGRLFDPKVEAQLARAKALEERNLSERPPGLPEEKLK